MEQFLTEFKDKNLLPKLLGTNLLPLAFLGDSLHTFYVRNKILNDYNEKMKNYHQKASYYCKASFQSKVLNKIYENLTEKEKEIVRRARNAKPKHTAKNATTKDYFMATAFEALLGYLYLDNQIERLEKILKLSMEEDK